MEIAVATVVLFLFVCVISNYFKGSRFYQFWSSHINPTRRAKENEYAISFYLIFLIISFLAAYFIICPLITKIFS